MGRLDGGGGSPAITGGGGRLGGISTINGVSKNPYLSAYTSVVAKQNQIDDLNAIGAGKSNMAYPDQINAIKMAAHQGLISNQDQFKYINAAVDKNTPATPGLNPVESVVKAIADPVIRIGNAAGEAVSQFNGTDDKINAATNEENQTELNTIKQSGQILRSPTATPQQKAQAQSTLAATTKQSTAQDAATQQMLSSRLDAVDPVKNAAAAADIALNFIPGADAVKGGELAIDAARLAAEGASKKVIADTVKGISKNVVAGTVTGAASGALSPVEQSGLKTNVNDIISGAEGGALAGGTIAGAGALAGKVGGKIISKATGKNVTPVVNDTINAADNTASAPGRLPVPGAALNPLPFGDTAIHLPDQGVYAKLAPEQVAHLRNEVSNVPSTANDMVHLSAITGPLKNGAQEVPLEQIAALSPNAKTALDNVPVAPDAPAIPPGNKSMLGTLPAALPGDIKAAPLAKQYIDNQYSQLGEKIKAAGDNLNSHDTALIPQIESTTSMTPTQAAQRVDDVSAKANDPTAFKTAVGALKDFSQARLANDQALGRPVGERQNYLSRFYKPPTGDAAAVLDHLKLSSGDQLPGYSKDRTIATQDEANALASLKNPDGSQKYPNLQPLHANVFEDAQHAVALAQADHGKQAMRIAFEQAHPGVKVGFGKVGFDSNTGTNYKELQINGAKGLTLPEHLANSYNKRAFPKEDNNFGVKLADGTIKPVRDNQVVQTLKETGGQLVDPVTGKSLHSNAVSRIVRSAVKNPIGAYDKLNANLKYSVLGGGTFHAVTTGGTVAGQQTVRALAHPLKIPGMIADNAKLVVGTLSKSAHEAHMAENEADGTVGFAHMAGVTLRAKQILGDANPNILDRAKESGLNPIKQIHDMVFDRQIPEAKLMIMKQAMQSKFKGMDFNAPTSEQLAYGRKVASTVNGIGGINRAVEGLSPKVAKNLGRVLLATDFTEGKFRILGNALTKGPTNPAGNLARQMVIGKSLVFAIPGLTALTVAGKLDWSNADQVRQAIQDQILDPSIPLNEKGAPTKSNPNGTNQAIHFPSTFLSELGKIIKPALDPLAPNKLQGLQDYVTNRAAAGIGVGARLIQNKDFFGNPIYGQDAQGNPISPGQAALNIGNQVAPIPFVQGQKSVNGQSITDSLLNTAGLKVSSDAQSASGQHTQAVNDFYNTLNTVQSAKTKVVKQVNDLVKSGNVQQAIRVANDYNQSIPSKLQPFKDKYASNYNPAWNTDFKTLNIAVSPRAINSRVKANEQAQKVISPNY